MIKIGLTDFTPVGKIIDIRDKNQVIKAKKAIGAEDVLSCTLMSEHYLELHFNLNANVPFKRSDYIEWQGEKYTLREDYQPEQENERSYRYTLKFEAVEMFFQDIQYYYLNQDLKESEWRLFGNPEYFLQMAVDNVNRYFGVTDFGIGTVEPTETKDILFNTNTNVFDALTQIAEEYGAEWYITGRTIHLLTKVAFGSEVAFEAGVSVQDMSRSEGESSERYTRIVALGSTRNLPKDYRTPTSGEGVDAVYPKRLRIPIAKGDVIDAYPGMAPDEVMEGTIIFDDIYPKRVGTIEAITTIEYTDTDEETGTQTKWNAYAFRDSGIDFKEEYVLPGEELRLQFQSGDLNGRDFALIFHKNGFPSAGSLQFFEIVRTDDYGTPTPNDILKPKVGDTYVLYGFNIALVGDQYVPAAEQELYDTASEWLSKQLKDTSVYECVTVIKHFQANLMDLAIGQKVRLANTPYAGDSRPSRIMGFEKKLNNTYDAVYTVGDNATYSRLANIEQEIKELQVAGIAYANTGGSGVYVIKQFDTTRPSDFNVYSAQASNAKYFNKQAGDTVQGDALFMRNLQVQGLAISDVFQNSTFTAGQLGSGFQVKRDVNGQSYMEVDNLLVRREAVFNRLTIAEIKSVGGTILLSLASLLVSKVEDAGGAWRCFFDTGDGTIPNDFTTGDMAICRKFTGQDVKYYWALVTAVGADYIELSKTDKDGSGIPDIGDEVVQLGNRTDVNRQHAIMLSAYGSDAPGIKQYSGISTYDLTGKEVTAISPKGNTFTGSFTVATNGTTAPVYKERGGFVNGTVYYLNDRVSYLGSLWVCMVSSTIATPSETSATWRKETTGQAELDKLRSEYQADFEVLDTKITSKVSQTDFDALGNRVSGTESGITQLAGSITSVVTAVEAAQTTADSKNRTYYQDAVPTVPSGGHKAGDLWYKVSLVDASGNINADTDKNIYQLQYRWNGSIWQQVNWAISKSKIEQTDSSINLIVEKTGVSSVGAGSSLYSMINQTAEQITLEVSKIQVGGRNYFKKSTPIDVYLGGSLVNRDNNGCTIVGTSGAECIARFSNVVDSIGYYTVSGYIKGNYANSVIFDFNDIPSVAVNFTTEWTYFSRTIYVGKYSAAVYNFMDIEKISYIYLYLKDLKVEKGNKATDWTPAPEDIAEIAGSALSITSNKISLGSKTIELKGTTLADAIRAGDLDVGNGNFHVGADGKIFARNAEISGKISASGGDIGGFAISSGMLKSPEQSGFTLTADSLWYAGENNGYIAAVGHNVVSATTGLRMLGRFDNVTSNPFTTNYALAVNVANGAGNVAIAGSGAVAMRGYVGSVKPNVLSIVSGSNAISIGEGAHVMVQCFYSSYIDAYLPSVSNIQTHLGLTSGEDFMVYMTVHAYYNNPYSFRLRPNGYSLYNWNAGTEAYRDMGKGDSITLVICRIASQVFAQTLTLTQ